MLELKTEEGVASVEPNALEVEGGDGNGKKSNSQILTDNRLKLYNDILNLKEKGFSDEYKRIGYKKFNQLLDTNSDFRTDLLTDLNDRGFNIPPGDFESAYVKGRKDEVYDFGAPAYTTTIKTEKAGAPIPKTSAPEEPVGDGTLDQIKGLAKSAYNYGKDFYNIVKRDFYTGQAQRGAQVEDFLTGDVDTENLAKYLKKANDVGEIGIEAAYAKDESVAKDAADFIGMIGPAVVGSFASMTAAGWDKMAGITAAGAATGAVAGSTVLPGLGTGAGALAGAGKGAQAAMVQQGYNLEFTSSVIDDLTEKGAINPNADEATLKKQLDAAFANKDLMKPIYEKAHTRAGIIMGVDIAASGIGGKVVGTLRRAAMSKPVARTTVGRVLQESAKQIAQTAPVRSAVRLAERAADVSNRFAKSQIGKPIAKVASDIDATDIMAGAGGEALAQLKTEGEINWKEVALEGGAEGSYIKALRALGDIGNKKKELTALPPSAGPKGLLTTDKKDDTEYVTVTDEEFANYKKGNIDPQRAAGIADDVDIALEDPSHLERLKADGDNLYYEMVLDAFNKHIVAVENQKLYNVALNDIAELYGKTPDEVKAAITPNSASFDEKIHKDFSTSFNVLQKQYREKAKNDSENAAGVSSEGGIGQESQQTQSQQGAGQEAAGDGGIFQEAEGEGRIAEIDDLLAEDDSFFAQNNERLLSPEERADLEQERSTLVAPAAATAGEVAATEVATTTTPAGVASSEVATEQTPSAATSNIAPDEEVGVTNIPIEDVRRANGAIGTQGFTSSQMKDLISFLNTKLGLGISEDLFKGDKIKPLIDFIGNNPDLVGKIENYVKTDPIEISRMPDDTIIINDGNHRANLLNLIGSKFLPTVETVNKKPAVETAAPTGTETKPSKKAKPAPAKPAAVPSTEAAAKPAPKEAQAKDVEVRKGKTHATDGVYEAVYKGKVIGKFSFDKKEKVWVDAAGDKFAQKKDAISKFVLQYNMKSEAAAETTTAKGEGKGKAAPTGKAGAAPTTETKGETKSTGKAETTTTAKTETEPTGAAMPSSIQDAYAKRATLRMTAEALQKQMKGKNLTGKSKKELDNVNAEIAKLDNLLNTFEKEREKQRAAKAKAEQTSEKKETKTEEKPTTLVGGTVKGMAYGNYLINQLVSNDPKGEESRQGYIDAWNAINKAQENANKANSFLEDILVGMMPADKKPTAYADIREGFKQQQAGETTTETKGEVKPTEKAESEPEPTPIKTTEKKTNPSFELMIDFETNGGVLEIGKRPNAVRYSILNLKVDENKRRQGIATRLLKKALDKTNGQLSGMAGNDGSVEMNYKLGMRAFDANGKELSLQETKDTRAKNAGESILMMLPEDKRGDNYKPFAKQKTGTFTKGVETKALPAFSEFDAISADRSKMKEAKAEFIAKHGQLAYDAMKEISANFTKITKALQEKEILTKKC